MNISFSHINEEVVALLKQTKAEPAFEGTVLEGREQKYAVVKLSDLAKYNSEFDLNHVAPLMDSLLGNIEAGRERDGKKPFNSYIVINTDEPYIDEVVELLERNNHWDGVPSNKAKYKTVCLSFERMKSLLIEMKENGDLEKYDTNDVFGLMKEVEDQEMNS